MTESKPVPTVRIGFASIHSITYRAAVSRILEMASRRESAYVVTPNIDHVVMLERSADLRAAYQSAALVTCDSTPIRWAARLLGTPLPERVTGSDLMPGLCKAGAASGLKVAIVGGPSGTAEAAGQILCERYPGLRVLWTYCPPLGFEKDAAESARICEKLDELSPDLVFLGVGAPKQELWIAKHRGAFRAGAILGIGAAIEFVAGTIPRAPKWMRKSGLEWVHRMASDPVRLVKRYTSDLVFVVIIAKQWLRR